ncbi:antibiotic biosynthesis monooxygenase [uncultured Imperialibacter sp.]|uniref:putative quinol monooxygenase n=2 Tax=uncultured Imperialibacter sp. TaxID=1672639 RepID=UPI0030D94A88
MLYVMVQFRVKEGHVQEAEKLIRGFIDNIRNNEPGTLAYQSFQFNHDVQEFVHLMCFTGEDADEKHKDSPYIKQFVDTLYPLCESEPRFHHLGLVAEK